MDTNRASAHTRAVGPLLLTAAAVCLLIVGCGQAGSRLQAPEIPTAELRPQRLRQRYHQSAPLHRM